MTINNNTNDTISNNNNKTDNNTDSYTKKKQSAHYKIGSVNSLIGTARYQSDPLSVYRLLCKDKDHNLLLESAEIDKKHLLKSLLLTDAAVKIVCNGNTVKFTALSLNGNAAVAFATEQLKNHAVLTSQVNEKTNRQALVATFNDVPTELDEKSRLMAINPFQSLRLFNQLLKAQNKAEVKVEDKVYDKAEYTTNNTQAIKDSLSKNSSQNHPFSVFLGGIFAFDMMSMSEELPHVPDGENTCPDFVYYLAETLVIIDHEEKSTEIIGNIFSGAEQQKCHDQISQRLSKIKQLLKQNITSSAIVSTNNNVTEKSNITPEKTNISTDINDEQFCNIVNELKENIRAGDIFQVVPSRTFSLPCCNNFNAYQELKKSNPSPYMFYLKDSEFCIFGASPESAIKYQHENRHVEIYPIAGTRPRGFTADGKFSLDLDSRIELELRLDKKELAEHIMLVDLARNDIARVSQPGTRHVADLLKVDRYSHVMHLVSRVCGTLDEQLDALHAYQACMNMGTLSGAPKVKATELIRQVEGKRRGSYGGAVGYITGEGEMDTCIVIRSAFVKNGIAQVQAGAGVVYDSDPQAEANETRQKAQAVLNAIVSANALSATDSVIYPATTNPATTNEQQEH